MDFKLVLEFIVNRTLPPPGSSGVMAYEVAAPSAENKIALLADMKRLLVNVTIPAPATEIIASGPHPMLLFLGQLLFGKVIEITSRFDHELQS